MSKIGYYWHSINPTKPDVYTTRRGESKYHTLRYWDGGRWWQIEWGANIRRAAKPFQWPKGSRTRFPSGLSRYRFTMGLRRINDPFQRDIWWGEPFKVFDREEVLKYLVKQGIITKDWETTYQLEMRIADQKGLL